MDKHQIEQVFKLQKAYWPETGQSTLKQRKFKLKKLYDSLVNNRQSLKNAVHNDFGKPPFEVDSTEILVVIAEIKHALRNLQRWMSTKKVSVPVTLLGTTSCIRYQSKGQVLIIAPWNFPILLNLCPLILAVAAGNVVIIKPSEFTPHTNAVLKKIIEEVFDPKEVILINGGVPTSQYLLSLPFDHIHFTGSPEIGKVVMTAAAQHLSSITLELGGKTPCVVDQQVNLKVVAQRITWGKFMNSGQICIAPDYILAHSSIIEELTFEIEKNIQKFYFTNEQDQPVNSSLIITEDHAKRLMSYFPDTKGNQGKRIVYPTVIVLNNPDHSIMKEEIFGPILPVIPYNHKDEALNIINELKRPLAMYIFSRSNTFIDHFLKNTRSGGVTINHSLIHYFNKELPMGGVGYSGTGRTHGQAGFESFSNIQSVTRQLGPLSMPSLFYPPYNEWKKRLLNLVIKYMS